MPVKTYTLYKRITIEVTRTIEAENFPEAYVKLSAMRHDRFFRVAPGAELMDSENAGGDSIHEERQS
jgi:hypothetical protein